jgi:hypothetical protein
MTGDHHGRSAERATLLVRTADGILGTHRRAADIWAWARRQGQEISERGRIAALVVAAYEAGR